MNNILTNREWKVDGNWYEPKNFIDGFASVLRCDLWNTTSSSGDWAGWFVQKIGKMHYLIMFYQSNNGWYNRGFTVTTGRILASWNDYNMTDEEIYEIISDYEKMSDYE